jgi:hypothetical protein
MHPDIPRSDAPGANYREHFAILCGSLPPPPNDTADIRAVRDRGAMDAVVPLHPEDAFETRLAVRACHRA